MKTHADRHGLQSSSYVLIWDFCFQLISTHLNELKCTKPLSSLRAKLSRRHRPPRNLPSQPQQHMRPIFSSYICCCRNRESCTGGERHNRYERRFGLCDFTFQTMHKFLEIALTAFNEPGRVQTRRHQWAGWNFCLIGLTLSNEISTKEIMGESQTDWLVREVCHGISRLRREREMMARLRWWHLYTYLRPVTRTVLQFLPYLTTSFVDWRMSCLIYNPFILDKTTPGITTAL